VRTPRLNEIVHHRNPTSPLSKGKVSYKLLLCVRGLGCGKGKFAENTSPTSENAKVERSSSPGKSSSPLSEDEVVELSGVQALKNPNPLKDVEG